MKTLFWNVRGLGNPTRRGQVKDYIWGEDLEIVGLQETRKQTFLDAELRDMSGLEISFGIGSLHRVCQEGSLLGLIRKDWRWKM